MVVAVLFSLAAVMVGSASFDRTRGVASAQDAGWVSYQGGPDHLGSGTGVRPGLRADWRVAAGGDARASGIAVIAGLAVAVGPTKVIGFDPATGNVLWTVDRARGPVVPPAIDPAGGEHGLILYVEGADRNTSALVALDASTHARVWTVPLGDVTRSAPTVSSGRVFLGGADGFVYAVDEDAGRPAWKARARGRVDPSVAVSEGRVFAVSENAASGTSALEAFRASDGKRLWSYAPARLPAGTSSPTVAGGLVYAGFGDDTVRALDAGTGAERWKAAVRTSFSPLSSPAFSDGALYALDRDGGLYRFDGSNGKREWDFQFPGTADWAAPVVSGGFVLAGLDDGTLAAVTVANGHLAWEADLGTGPLGPLAVATDRLLVPSVGGRGGVTAFIHDPAAKLVDRPSPTRLEFGPALLSFVAAAVLVLVALTAVLRRAGRRVQPLFPPAPGPGWQAAPEPAGAGSPEGNGGGR